MRFLLALLVLAAAAARAAEPAAPVPTAASLYARWTGAWSGVLEYRDYQPPHGRVSLPTTLAVTLAPDAAALMSSTRS